MTRVLLVTGSRSLAPRNMLGATAAEIERERIDAPRREAWARGLIRAALAGEGR